MDSFLKVASHNTAAAASGMGGSGCRPRAHCRRHATSRHALWSVGASDVASLHGRPVARDWRKRYGAHCRDALPDVFDVFVTMRRSFDVDITHNAV